MRKRWKIAIGFGGLLLAGILAPIAYIETSCGGPAPEVVRQGHRTLLAPRYWRAEERTWLTYPEWYIVYSAESYGRFLDQRPPSAFPYLRHIKGFWTGYCALNRVAAGAEGARDAKIMLYTIGISYSVELGLKGIYENTIGRLFEALGGWRSADDRYSAEVQKRYGAFMHETPWYGFNFGEALSGLWKTEEPDARLRHWERRMALSTEYGAKAGYAKLIGWASNASLGPDDVRLQMVVEASPDAVAAVDPRLKPLRAIAGGRLVVDAPRYAQFTELLVALAGSPVRLVEIAGNDDIFLTVILPDAASPPAGAVSLLSVPLDERPGFRRVGLSTSVPALPRIIRETLAGGGTIEHVYDY